MSCGRPNCPGLAAACFAALLACFAAGCLEDLPSPSKVDSMRVLGIQADPPEAAPGATVALRALAVDPAGRPLRIRWYACVIAERGSGFTGGGAGQTGFSGGQGYGLAEPGECASDEAVASGLAVAIGAGEDAVLAIPSDFLSLENTRRVYGLGDDVEPSELELLGLWSIAGLNYTVAARVEALANGEPVEELTAYKRVNVSLAQPPNANPGALAFDVRLDGDPHPEGDELHVAPAPPGRCFAAPMPVGPGAHRITPLNVPEPPVVYPVLVSGTSAEQLFEVRDNEETLFYSFFSQVGSFSSSITKSTGGRASTWNLDGDALSDSFDLWIVVRDGRGGLSWCHEEWDPSADSTPLAR